MLLVSWLLVVLVIVVFIARMIADRYTTTSPPTGVFRKFRNGHLKKPTLSVVIPCFNEATRLPSMLSDCVAYIRGLESDVNVSPFRDVELIVVNDCSTDDTVEVAKKCIRDANGSTGAETADKNDESSSLIRFSVVDVKPNHGKGYAVRSGFFAASGDLVLMADGDNATRFSDVDKLYEAMERTGADIVVGSRAHMEKESIATRTLSRTILMKLFHVVVDVTYFIGTMGKRCPIKDTQCGFKLFRRRQTDKVFENNRLERWAFDVELLILARRLECHVAEVPVNWQEVPGSKVRISGMIQMGLECLLMCFAYPFGLWEVLTTRRLL